MTETELLLVGCDSTFIEKNIVNTVEVTENQPAFDYSLESQLAIQLTPQRAKLKLKKSNRKSSFQIELINFFHFSANTKN